MIHYVIFLNGLVPRTIFDSATYSVNVIVCFDQLKAQKQVGATYVSQLCPDLAVDFQHLSLIVYTMCIGSFVFQHCAFSRIFDEVQFSYNIQLFMR